MKKIIIFLFVIFIITSISVSAKGEFDGINVENSYFGTPEETVQNILSGDLTLNNSDIISNIIEILFSTLKDDLPLFTSLLCCGIIMAFAQNISVLGTGYEIALIGGKIIVSTLIITPSMILLKKVSATLSSISQFTSALIPPLTTLLASCGAQTTVAVLTPSSALISTTLINLISKMVFPLITSGLVISLCGGCVKNLSGISDFFKSTASWMLGICLTVFSGIITVQGLVSSVSDGVSLNGVRYLISSTVPVIGATVSKSVSMLISSAYYLKNAGGIMGIIMILQFILPPLIEIVCLYFTLKTLCSVLMIFSDNNSLPVIKKSSEFIKLAGLSLLGVGVIWFIFLGLIILCGGSV